MENLRRRKAFGPPPKPDPNSPQTDLKPVEANERAPTNKTTKVKLQPRSAFRSAAEILGILGCILYLVWVTYRAHNYSLPEPLDTQISKDRFSEERAQLGLTILSSLGPHEFGSMLLEYASVDTRMLLNNILLDEVPITVDMELEWQNAHSGAIEFPKKTVVFDSLRNLLVRLSPKGKPEAKENAILVSTHIDSIKFTMGAGDSLSNVVTMVELVRNMAQVADQFANALVFLFNTGEEEGLMGATAFMQQHPWASTIRTFVNLEALGVGGPSLVFQAYPSGWLLKEFCKVAPHPATSIIAQDIFRSGVLGSLTDFQVYRREGNLSGIDFAFLDHGGVYHTRYDHHSNLRPGSIQHLGENMHSLLKHVAKSPELGKQATNQSTSRAEVVYFDAFGKFMFVVSSSGMQIVYLIVASQFFLFLAPMVVGPKTGDWIAFVYTLLALLLTFFFGLLLPLGVACLLPLISLNPIPYFAENLLALGLFGAPAVLGGLLGEAAGRWLLAAHLRRRRMDMERLGQQKRRKHKASVVEEVKEETDSDNADAGRSEVRTEGEKGEDDGKAAAGEGEDEGEEYESLQEKYERSVERERKVAWEAERWLYVGACVYWLVLMLLAASVRLGSAFYACLWLLLPAFTFASLEGDRVAASDGVKLSTLAAGLALPVVLSANSFLRIPAAVITLVSRIDTTPGSVSPAMANSLVAAVVSLVLLSCFLYLLPFATRRGAAPVLGWLCAIVSVVCMVIAAVEGVPPFSQTAPKKLVAVSLYPDLVELKGQRVEWRHLAHLPLDDPSLPFGVISVSSLTPGNITKDVQKIDGFDCSHEDIPDFVTFDSKFSCSIASRVPTNIGADVPGYFYNYTLQESVTEMEVLSDTGRNAAGVDKWREGLQWWGGHARDWGAAGHHDEWAGWRDVREKGEDSGRVTRVGIKTGISRRWNLAVDATRIHAFSLGVVNGTLRKYVTRKISPEEKWHQIAVRVRYDYYSWVNQFIIKLHWRKYVAKVEKSRPLLRIRSDVQEGYPREIDENIESVIKQLPRFVVQFGKSSLPTNQAFADVLYFD